MVSRSLSAQLAHDIASGRWSEHEPLPGVRTLAREVGCSAGTVARAYAALRDAGVLAGTPRSRFVVAAGGAARAARWRADSRAPLRVGGSDDPAFDLLLRAAGDGVTVIPGPRGSVNGIVALSRGVVDAAAVHLLDVASGRWNDPIARGSLGGAPVALVHLWRREQGLVVARGNPHGITGVADLAGRRIAWRPPGTGSRLLLERLMLAAGCAPHPEEGEPAESHLAVAESAGLDWVPVLSEPFELALDPAAKPAAAALLSTLADPGVQARLAALPGYDLSHCGELRMAA